MQRLKKSYIRCALALGLALILLMVLGSLLDLPLSRALYPGHENSLGQFFAAFGELPGFTFIFCAGVLLFLNRKQINRAWSAIVGLGGLGGCLLAVIVSVHEAVDNVPALPLWAALLVTLFFMAVSGLAVAWYARGASAKTVLRFVLAVLFVTIGAMILINIIKVPWGRARMRLIVATGNESYFTPWWKAGSELKNRLVIEGVSKDEFRSFPSGHTGTAACAILLALLPTLQRGKRKKIALPFAIGCVWTLAVAFTRIWMGAHFLTDVSFAWLVTLGLSVVGVWLFYFNNRFYDELWRLVTGLTNPFTQKPKDVFASNEEEF